MRSTDKVFGSENDSGEENPKYSLPNLPESILYNLPDSNWLSCDDTYSSLSLSEHTSVSCCLVPLSMLRRGLN